MDDDVLILTEPVSCLLNFEDSLLLLVVLQFCRGCCVVLQCGLASSYCELIMSQFGTILNIVKN